MNNQLTIYDYLNIQNPRVPPKFDRSLFDDEKIQPKTLDVFYEFYPETPVYFVTKRMGSASPLFYKALICTYTGWWHALQGWNIDNRHIESWELIEGEQIKDWANYNPPKLAWTPEEYEKIKDKSIKEIITMAKKERSNT